MTHSVFLPHYGLGHNNWVRVALPRSFYRDPVPLLLCDRVYIDESVFIADDFGDAPAYRLLEELRSANVVDTMEFSATVTLDDTFWNLWPEMQSAVLGSVALPPQRGITHPHDALRGWNDLSSENANRPEAEEVFQLAVEAWYTLAVSAALEVPYFQDDATCLFFLDLLHRLLAGHQIAAQPTGPLEVTTYTGLIRLARVKTPSLPIIVDEDGDGSEPGAVFFDNILSYASDAERTRAYDESRRALDRVLALRNHELLGSFREYLKEVRNDVDAHAAEADYAASVAIEHQKRLDEVNAAIGREFHGFTRFATTASYVSLATGLPGLINPVIGAVSLGAAVAATTADVVKKRKIERMKRNPRFYQENRRYNWHAYYLELARAYEES